MSKITNYTLEAFKTFFKTIKIYLTNLPEFFQYMSFPVIGTIVGLFLILAPTYFFANWTQTPDGMKFVFNNYFLSLLALIICIIPGFLLFCKAFLDYIVAMVSLSRSACDLVATDELVNDLKSYNSIIEYREIHYFFLIFILAFIYGIFSFPIFILLEILFFLYTSLSIPAFAHDDRLSAFDAIKRSFQVLPGHVIPTAILLLLLGLVTYLIIPTLAYLGLEYLGAIKILSIPVAALFSKMPVEFLNANLASLNIDFTFSIDFWAKFVTGVLVSNVITMYLLPIRAVACTLWYDLLYNNGKK